MTEYVTHALIRPEMVEQRLYQLSLASFALERSSLIVLPTGLGKTIVALMVMAARLSGQKATPKSKVLILSPTKPLVDQHVRFFKKAFNIPEEQVVAFTGSIAPAKRKDIWQNARIIISTPQVIENDILSKRIDLSDVVHITFDEAHRAIGNYAYVYIAAKYHQQASNPLILAITASPGSEDEKVAQVCQNLYIEAVKVKTEDDADVAPYVFKKDIEWVKLELPAELLALKKQLEDIFRSQLDTLSEMGYRISTNVSKRELLAVSGRMQARLHSQEAGAMADDGRDIPDVHNPNAAGDIYQALSMHAQAVKIYHAIELIETQGAQSLWKYLDRMRHESRLKGSSKASKRLVEDIRVKKVMEAAYKCVVEHPKLAAATDIVAKQLTGRPESRVIVFTQYRDTAKFVEDALNAHEGIRAVRFVGQANNFKDAGLSQKEQVKAIEMFKEGAYNVLVATSVAEEGLDIPSTDLVLFYEPVTSAIRSIQRKGRTGRKHEGRVVVLITKKTRDEAFLHISRHRENRMQATMKKLEDMLLERDGDASQEESMIKPDGPKVSGLKPDGQMSIENYGNNDDDGGECCDGPEGSDMPADGAVVVHVDSRESRGGVAKLLEETGVSVLLQNLEVGDYILSDRVGVERKTVDDFLESLVNPARGMFEQISNLARTFTRPLLILEGDDLYTRRQIHPNSIRGALASIAVDFNVSIIPTRDARDTAQFLAAIAKREQVGEKRSISLHGKKTAMMLTEQQEYVVSSISNIGPGTAEKLLEHFGSVEGVMTATVEELKKVDSVGSKTAQRIREVVGSEYKK